MDPVEGAAAYMNLKYNLGNDATMEKIIHMLNE